MAMTLPWFGGGLGTGSQSQQRLGSSGLGFNIPSDLYASSGSGSKSQSYSGLLGNLQSQFLEPYLKEAMPLQKQYSQVLSQLASPSSFIEAYRPVQKSLFNNMINDLSNRGILDSTVASNTLAQGGQNLASTYLQQLMGIANLFGQGQGSILSGLNLGTGSTGTSTSQSYQEDPLEPYRLMAQLLGYM